MSWASRAGAASGGFFWRGGEAGAVRGGVDKKNCHAGNAAAAAAASRSRSTTRPAHGHGSGAAAAGGGSKASINGGGGGGGGGGSGGGRGGRGGSGGNGRGFTRFVVAGVAVSAVAGAAITWVNASGGDGLGLLDSASSSTPTFASNSNSKSPEAAAAASAAASDGVPVDTSADTAAAASSSSSATGSEDGARDLSAADAAAHRAAVDMWRSRWDEGNVGFHLPAAHHLLVRYKTALLGEGVTSPPELSKRIFVPLCGKAVDMLWLPAACGHRVYGVELSGAAAAEFFAESGMPRSVASADRPPANGLDPSSRGAGVKRVHTSGNVAVIEGDIFSLRGTSPSALLPNDDHDTYDNYDKHKYNSYVGDGDGEGDGHGHGHGHGHGDTVSAPNREHGAAAQLAARAAAAAAAAAARAAQANDAEDAAADARVGAQGSISFTEESLRLAAGGGPAMDAVWDRGALVAIEPSLRGKYASLVADRLAPGGRMLVVTVSYDPGAGVTGPPHSVSPEDLRGLYKPLGLGVRLLGSEERIDAASPRMREKLSSMTESVYLVTKPARPARRHLW